MHTPLGLGDHVSDLDYRFLRYATTLARHFEREGIETLAVLIRFVYPFVDKGLLCQPVIKDVARDSGKPDEIGAGTRMQEDICAAGHLVLAQVADDEFLATEFMGSLDARSQNGMALGRIAADDDNQSACSMSLIEPESPP